MAISMPDPHPGNIWIKNGKIIWLDLGMMGRLSSKERDALKKLFTPLFNMILMK